MSFQVSTFEQMEQLNLRKRSLQNGWNYHFISKFDFHMYNDFELECSWCYAIYYYSLTQTSILWNGNWNCASGYRALKVSSNLEKFPFWKRASGNRALKFMGNFRKFPGNFLETVRVVTGQETVRVGMWSRHITLQWSERLSCCHYTEAKSMWDAAYSALFTIHKKCTSFLSLLKCQRIEINSVLNGWSICNC